MEFVRIGMLAVAGIALGIQFRNQKQEYSLYVGLAVCLLIFSCTLAYMGQVKEQMGEIFAFVASGRQYFVLLFKVAGITWVCEFVAGVCRDSGFSAVAAQMELFGKMAVLFAGMPVILALAKTVAGFAG